MASPLINSAEHGGATYLENGCTRTVTLEPNTHLDLCHNHAAGFGGGIYYEDSITPLQCNFSMRENSDMKIAVLPHCFLGLEGLHFNDNSSNHTIVSRFNSAEKSGNFCLED